MTSTQRVTSTDGVQLAVYDAGIPSGPVVLAVHGYPDDHAVWTGVADALGDRYRVVSYDVRGAGASDKPTARSAYRLDQLVDDLRSVVGALAPDRAVHLLGHDWGSVQGWAAVSDTRPDGRIASFTSISGPSLDHATAWLRAGHRYPRAALRQLADSWYTLLFQVPRLPEAAIRAGLIERAVGPRDRADQLHGLNLYRANMFHALRRTQPGQIGVPVQVLAPERDPYVTPDLAFGAPSQYVRDLRTTVVDGGHWVIKRRPEVIAARVAGFIDDVERAAT
jgi:pimeloyl-ACP methyl ester carboxylesterase